MQKGPNLNNTQKESETGNHPQHVPGLQKRAPVKSYRQHLCRRGNNIGDDGFGETKKEAPTPEPVCKSQKGGGYKREKLLNIGL